MLFNHSLLLDIQVPFPTPIFHPIFYPLLSNASGCKFLSKSPYLEQISREEISDLKSIFFYGNGYKLPNWSSKRCYYAILSP